MPELRTTEAPATATIKPAILCVDDDASNLVVMQMRLESRYEVLVAASDHETCVQLRDHGHRLAAVLMDVQLIGSQLDGIALTRLIRGTLDPAKLQGLPDGVPTFADLPVLFVTAFGEQYDQQSLLAAGASGIIAKPVNFVKLAGALTRHQLRGILGRGLA